MNEVGKPLIGVSLDVFDRRYAVYSQVFHFMLLCMHEGLEDPQKAEAFLAAKQTAHFLFEEDVSAFLQEVWKNATCIHTYGRLLGHAPTEENIRLHHNAIVWMEEHQRTLARRFQNALNISDIKPFVSDNTGSIYELILGSA